MPETRFFIRFGEVPESARSKMWTAPNAFLHDTIGQELPGLSAYEVTREEGKWVLQTDDVNVGSGMASLMELFASAASEPDQNPIFLLRGQATCWSNMTEDERRAFADWDPGEGREHFDILGTDGEPLVREFEIVGNVAVTDLVCAMVDYPGAWDEGDDIADPEADGWPKP